MYLCCGYVILGVYLLYNIDRLRQSAAVLPFAAVFPITRFLFRRFFFFFTLLCILFVCKLLTRSLVYVIVANLVFVLVCNPSYQVSTQNVDSAAGTLEHL